MHTTERFGQNEQEEDTMFTRATVGLAVILGTLASAPAKADHNPGGPVRNGDQCWYNANKRHADFGYWAACPASRGAVMRETPHGYEWVDGPQRPSH
jgi:hypothetical protein